MKFIAIITFTSMVIMNYGCIDKNDQNPNQGSMVELYDIHTLKVYESKLKPGHNQFPAAFMDNEGGICVVFQQITGDLRQAPTYNFRNPGKDFKIKLICMRMEKSGKEFKQIWEKEMIKPHSFVIPAPTPSLDGKMIAMCRPSASTDFDGIPEKSVVIIESSDFGKTLKLRSIISMSDTLLAPNDMRYVGKTLYVATYDGKGAAHLFSSDDDGRTWSNPFEITKMHDNMSFHEPTFVGLPDGDIVVFLRTHRMDIPNHNGINYHKVIISRNRQGKMQASPVQDTGFGFRGRPYILRSSGGILVLACPGKFLAFSLNEGKTWESGQWDFGIEEIMITDQSGTKPYSWNAETALLELPDGRFYYSYFIGSDFPFPAPCDEYIGGTFFKLKKVE